MGEDECGAGNVADLAGAGGDVLESAPALVEQGEPAFEQVSARLPSGVPRRPRSASSSFATNCASSLGTSSVAR